MRAAQIHAIGEPPQLGELPAPEPGQGAAIVEVAAVALNPVDIAVGTGRFYGGHPPLPYVPGCEAVGRIRERDTKVYVFGSGLGVMRDGTLAEVVAVPETAAFEIPEDTDEVLAVAAGIAGVAGWAAATRRADIQPDDRVLVLGATGTVGRVALQAARIRGARRIVAAGRDQQRLERTLGLGAHATIRLGDRDTLADEIAEACGGDGPTVVIDTLWGPPVQAALTAAAPGARAINIGQSAGPEATLTSAVVRGKQLNVLGYSNFASLEAYRAAYLELLGHVAAGDVRIDVERYPLDRVAEAWQRQADGAGTKIVVTP